MGVRLAWWRTSPPLKSLGNLYEVDAGIEPDRVLAFTVDLSQRGRRPWEEGLAFAMALRDRLDQQPGVVGATASVWPLLGSTAVMLAIVAFASSAVPAWRATRLPPRDALGSE
jgi:hypothetical protein